MGWTVKITSRVVSIKGCNIWNALITVSRNHLTNVSYSFDSFDWWVGASFHMEFSRMWAIACRRARTGASGSAQAFFPCLLCSVSYITNCVVISDVTFFRPQLLQPRRLKWCYREWKRALDQESRQVALLLPLWGPALSSSWLRCCPASSFSVLSGQGTWELPLSSGSWGLLMQGSKHRRINSGSLLSRGWGYPWKLS